MVYRTKCDIKQNVIFPGIKAGLGMSGTNADSQWNPVYNAFHRNFGSRNETIRR